MADERLKTAASVVRCGQSLAQPMDEAPARWQEYWDVCNSPGGAYTDEELQPLGITAEQLTAAVGLLENFNSFMAGQTPTVNIYRIIVNALRHVGAQI